MTVYKKILYNGDKVQVDSAVRDGDGRDIANTYQPELTAGTNITIDENNVISAAGGAGWELVTDKDLSHFVHYDSNNDFVITEEIKILCVYLNGSGGSANCSLSHFMPLKISSINFSYATYLYIGNKGFTNYFYTELYVSTSGKYRYITLSTPQASSAFSSSDGVITNNNQLTTNDVPIVSTSGAYYAIYKRS